MRSVARSAGVVIQQAATPAAALQRRGSLGRTPAPALLRRALRDLQAAPLGVAGTRLLSSGSENVETKPHLAAGGPTPAPLAPPSAVLVKVGTSDYLRLNLDGAAVLGMALGGVLKAITKDELMVAELRGVKATRCTVSVVPLPPGAVRPGDDVSGAQLVRTMTVGDAAAQAGWSGGSKLFIRVHVPDPHVADPARLPRWPDPIEVKSAGFNDEAGAPMHKITVNGDPIFLPDKALQMVVDWASGELSSEISSQKLLALTGPIKCGKTKLLQLLPRFLKRTGRRPVVMFFTFHLGGAPAAASQQLVDAAVKLAEDVGMTLRNVPTTEAEALRKFPDVIAALAAGIYAAGGQLILLLDEAQAPLLAAEEPKDAEVFTYKLKTLHRLCYPTTRIAIVGSDMFTLLSTIRRLPSNGYSLWSAMARVHLGATPGDAEARLMANAIVASRSKHWPPEVQKRISPEAVMEWLRLGKVVFDEKAGGEGKEPGADGAVCAGGDSDEAQHSLPMMCPRPAMVAAFTDLMRSAKVGTPKEIAENAMLELRLKILEEAGLDASVGLEGLDQPTRALLYQLAQGKLTRDVLEHKLAKYQWTRLQQVLYTLCEPVSGKPAQPVKLLPPYGALFCKIMREDGSLALEWYHGRLYTEENTARRSSSGVASTR